MTHALAVSTWYARVFTSTEQQLFLWCGDERQAIALAKHVTLPADATAEQIASAVTLALVRIKIAAGGDPCVEIVFAERRDNRREQ
jgi:hypothetical protein